MAKIASSTRVRRRLHAIPVALGLIALLIAVLVDHRIKNTESISGQPQTKTEIESVPVAALTE